jgi:predicted thioesterase
MQNIRTGLSNQLEEHVTDANSTLSVGSGMLEVYSTPSMIALVEKTSLKCIDPYLEKEQTSIGGLVNVLHLRSTTIGKQVLCKSEVKSVDKKKIEFYVEVYENDLLIGKGTHTKFIVNRVSFMIGL